MKIKQIMCGAALALACSLSVGAESKYAPLYKGLQFDMPVIDAPQFPGLTVSITDFGGVGDGLTLNTQAFADGIESLSKRGGGTLNVPEGVWYTGPIELKSNINLHLDAGALIVFADDESLYKTVYVVYEGFEAWRTQSPISGRGLENVASMADMPRWLFPPLCSSVASATKAVFS